MVRWADFAAQAPELASLGTARFDATGLCLVGTLRRDGWPRISPVEPLIADGNLYLGMMPRSTKALDLRRDPRCVVHSTTSDRHGSEGDFKLYGVAVEISDPGELDRYGEALYDAIEWRPEGDFHLFAVDVTAAAYVRIEDGAMRVRAWRPGEPVTDRVRE
jgi:Pyridoxamine 5'-phosphate oxidase